MKGCWPITLVCEVLQVSASGYFRWNACTRGTKPGGRRQYSDDALLAHIRAIHEQLRGEYGWPRMHRELLARGLCGVDPLPWTGTGLILKPFQVWSRYARRHPQQLQTALRCSFQSSGVRGSPGRCGGAGGCTSLQSR